MSDWSTFLVCALLGGGAGSCFARSERAKSARKSTRLAYAGVSLMAIGFVFAVVAAGINLETVSIQTPLQPIPSAVVP